MSMSTELHLTNIKEPQEVMDSEWEDSEGVLSSNCVSLLWVAMFSPSDLVEVRMDDNEYILPFTTRDKAISRLESHVAYFEVIFESNGIIQSYVNSLIHLLEESSIEYVYIWLFGLDWSSDDEDELEQCVDAIERHDLEAKQLYCEFCDLYPARKLLPTSFIQDRKNKGKVTIEDYYNMTGILGTHLEGELIV